MSTKISDGWTIETYETNGGTLRQAITSPAGRTATADYIGFDCRLSEYRTRANIEFGSYSLNLTEPLVDRMIAAAIEYADAAQAAEPEFSLDQI